VRHGHRGEVAHKSKRMEYFYSIHKELKNKYDPKFVENMRE
jgi:hypothetical protein